MSGSVPISDLEKMLEEKRSEKKKCSDYIDNLRHSMTDADYTEEQLENMRREGGGMLPDRILDKMHPYQSKEIKLGPQIKLLEEIINKYKK